MQASMARLLVVSVAVATTLSFGCGGPEQGELVTQVQWSSSTSQCLADQTPIFLNGESSPSTCQALQKVATEEGLEVTTGSRRPGPVPFGFCCEMECTDSGGVTTCGPLKCGPCKY